MAHFAQLDENNVVTQVIIIDNKDITDRHTGQEDEILGIAFCKKLLGGNWVQTSYNNKLRVRYAGIGYSYDKTRDAFIPPKPFPSWVLSDETLDWVSPIGPAPILSESELLSGYRYDWNEVTTTWNLYTPPKPVSE